MASLFAFPSNSYATCVTSLQSQIIAAAYEGDEVPTVHTIDTCSGDDISYQIPIATTITFDGVQYSNVYATTNSVITFGQPDNTYWDYPSTPSISLYSMDWVGGWYGAPEGLDISYSEGGFQLNLQAIPFGNWGASPSNINILVAITNTGGISVAYSYQGPEYANLRTGVRLHNGDIVSLEQWGARQVQPGSTQTLSSDPVVVGPTQEELQQQEEIRTFNSNLAAAVGANNVVMPDPIIITEPEVITPEPDVVVEPEIITPEDPRFPDNQEQTEPDSSNPSPAPETNDEVVPTPSPEPSPVVEPSPEPSPQPTDINLIEDSAQTEDVLVVLDKSQIDDSTNNLIKQLSDLTNTNTISKLSPEQKAAVAGALGIKTDEILLVAKLASENEFVAKALESFRDKVKQNADAPMPYTLADAIVEEKVDALLSNPGAVLQDMFSFDFGDLSSLGKDMTDDQREKVQEIVVPVIIASNIVAASMTRRK